MFQVFPCISCPPSPLLPLLLRSSFPYKPGTFCFPRRGLLACGYVCGHMRLCLCQQKVLRINKILCRDHITSSRSQTLIFSTWDMIFGQHPHSRVTDEKVRSPQGVLRACLMSRLSHWQKTKNLSQKINSFSLLLLLSSSICLYFSLHLLADDFVWRCQILLPQLMICFNSLLEAN